MKSPIILGLVLVTVASTALTGVPSKPATVYPASIVGPSRLLYPSTPHRKSFVVEVEEVDNESCEMATDGLTLRVLPDEWLAKPVAERKYCSAYRKFELTLVDLTGDGVEEFVLVTGEGHGTGVTAETLVVWVRNKDSFESILSIPFSGYFGGGRGWWYQPEYTDTDHDGKIDLRLTLKHSPLGESSLEDPCLIPEVILEEFVFDPQEAKLTLYRSVRGKPMKGCTRSGKE